MRWPAHFDSFSYNTSNKHVARLFQPSKLFISPQRSGQLTHYSSFFIPTFRQKNQVSIQVNHHGSDLFDSKAQTHSKAKVHSYEYRQHMPSGWGKLTATPLVHRKYAHGVQLSECERTCCPTDHYLVCHCRRGDLQLRLFQGIC